MPEEETSSPDPDKRPLGRRIAKRTARAMGGAVGAGLVLIVLPSIALVWFLKEFSDVPSVGLPVLAIFGIMILFGALALVSTLFERLKLSDKREALALPPGSVRAAIALALIVLFALISVMLYQSLERPYEVENLTKAQKDELVKDPVNRIIAVVPKRCPAAPPQGDAEAPACTPGEVVYAVHLRLTPGTESTDFAKQLLILIGTLMTSVTSFYFASRSSEATTKEAIKALAPAPPGGTAAPPGAPTVSRVATPDHGGGDGAPPAQPIAAEHGEAPDAEAHVDGCDVQITDVTEDADLPPSRGGVAS